MVGPKLYLTLLPSNIYFRQAFQSASLRPRHQSRGQIPAFGHGGQQRFHASKLRSWDKRDTAHKLLDQGKGRTLEAKFGHQKYGSWLCFQDVSSGSLKWITMIFRCLSPASDCMARTASAWDLEGGIKIGLINGDIMRVHEISGWFKALHSCDAITWFFPIHKRCISGFVALSDTLFCRQPFSAALRCIARLAKALELLLLLSWWKTHSSNGNFELLSWDPGDCFVPRNPRTREGLRWECHWLYLDDPPGTPRRIQPTPSTKIEAHWQRTDWKELNH